MVETVLMSVFWQVLNIGLRLDNPPACGLRLCRLFYILFFKAFNHQESERFEKWYRLSAVLGSVVRLGSVRSEQTEDQTPWRTLLESSQRLLVEFLQGTHWLAFAKSA